MSRRRNERRLKQALADLARLHPDDSAAIRDVLDPRERARLDGLAAGAPATPPSEPAEPAWIWPGVSPWLVDRIEADAGTGRGGAFVLMTSASVEALRAAAEPCRTQAGRARGATLLSRMLGFVNGPRT
jgi:hypothetical protein